MPARTTPPSPEELFGSPIPGTEAPGATDAAIANAERVLGVSLPSALTTLLRFRNGGRLRLNLYTLKTSPPKGSYAQKKYRVPEIAGVGSENRQSVEFLLSLARKEWGLPIGLVPICGDGHWWCCLDYRACGPTGEPAVLHYENDDVPREIPVAPSVPALLAGLRRNLESLNPALIALDEGAPRGDQLVAALESLGLAPWKPPGGSSSLHPLPPAWEWKKYKSFVKGCDCRVELWRNKLHNISQILTRQRSQSHPILCVSVALDQEDACLTELLKALGPRAVLLQRLE